MNATPPLSTHLEKHSHFTGTAVVTVLALTAFAANSILCRLALEGRAIDPLSFTSVRLLSAALTVGILGGLYRNRYRVGGYPGNWISAFSLFLYANTFSYAYLQLSAGTGALILFGAVQLTMFAWGIGSGERPALLHYGGIITALAGFVYLMFPRLDMPSPTGALLMAVAGLSWGVYSIRGQGSKNPVAETGGNFLRTIPLIIPLTIFFFRNMDLSYQGILLGVISGSLASGCGYVLWYKALRNLSTTRAATAQLTVPVLAALGGVLLLHEPITLHLVISALLIISGVSCHLLYRR